jgi:hypothetical protein
LNFGRIFSPAQEVGNDLVVFHAEAGLKLLAGERLANFESEPMPAFEMMLAGVDDDPVPIEDGAVGQ